MELTIMPVGLIDWWSYAPALGKAALRTFEFTVVGFTGAAALGVALALMRGGSLPMRVVARVYTELVKNLPLLAVVFLIYFGLTSVGLVLNSFMAGSLALALVFGAYMAELFRGSLLSVSRGQREGAQAVGLSGTTAVRTVVLPQALRIALPGAGTMLVDLLKSTSLMITIAGGELMTTGQEMASITFRPLEVYLGLGAIYFALCFPLSRAVAMLEKRTNSGDPILPGRRKLHRQIRRQLGDLAPTVPRTAAR